MRLTLLILGLALAAGCAPGNPQGGSSSTTGSAPSGTPAVNFTTGLEDSESLEKFRELEADWRKNPRGVTEQLQYLQGLTYVAYLHVQEEQPKRAYQAWLEQERIASKLATQKEELEIEHWRIVAGAFYNGGCAHSRLEEYDAALAALDQAVAWGYAEFDQMQKDPDLAPLFEQHPFAELQPKWETTALAVGRERATALMKTTEPFVFDFEVEDLEGETRKLADYKGSVAIVDIWGTWCPPCKQEIPHFIRIVKENEGKEFKMLGLNYNEDSADDVRQFIEKTGINYPCALREGEQPSEDEIPNFEGFPTTLFLDRTGAVRLKAVGYHDYYLLKGAVDLLLEEKG